MRWRVITRWWRTPRRSRSSSTTIRPCRASTWLLRLIARLSQHPNIVGIKETGSDAAQVGAFVDVAAASFSVIAGSAPPFYPALCMGAVGGILAVACVVPELCVRALSALPRRTPRRRPRVAATDYAARAAGDDRVRRAGAEGRDDDGRISRRCASVAAVSRTGRRGRSDSRRVHHAPGLRRRSVR